MPTRKLKCRGWPQDCYTIKLASLWGITLYYEIKSWFIFSYDTIPRFKTPKPTEVLAQFKLEYFTYNNQY